MVLLNTSKSFICDFDLKMTLDSFAVKNQGIMREFIKCLNEKKLYIKLMDAAIHKRVFKPDIKSKVDRSENCGYTLINEFKSKCFTLELLCECMKGHGLSELFEVLGVIEKVFVIYQSGPTVSCSYGNELTLSYIVEGYPKPTFQWYYADKLIPGASEDKLTLENFSRIYVGNYHCIAEQNTTNFQRTVLKSDPIECILLEAPPAIERNLPAELCCPEDEEISLKIIANNGFTGQYDWFYHNQRIDCCNSNCLTIKNFTPMHVGNYKCILTNNAGETVSNSCHLKILPPLLRPSAKLALLFGNGNYTNFSPLRTPPEDVKLLAFYLKHLGFTVFSYTDLSNADAEYELIQFLSKVPDKAFVFLYFSGHGFEYCNNKFFMPVDCPPSSSYSTGNDCLSYERVIKDTMFTKPLMLISVLDMCLAGPDEKENPQIFSENLKHYAYKKSAHSCFIEACATSDYQLAFETKSEKNGLYCRCLCKQIMEDLPIDDIFNAAHADFINQVRKRRQSPQFKYVYGEQECKHFRLNMKIRNGKFNLKYKDPHLGHKS